MSSQNQSVSREPLEPAEAQLPEAQPESEASAPFVQKGRLWPVFAALGAVVLAGAFFLYRSLTAPEPLRVLVAIDLDGFWWEGSRPAAALADELAERLTQLGFEPVRGGDPAVAAVLEKAKAPEEAAKKLRASFLVEARIVPETIEHPLAKPYFEVRTDAAVLLRHLPSGTSRQSQIHGFSGASEKEKALSLLAESMADQTLDAVITSLTETPAVKEMLAGSDMQKLAQLNPARDFVKDRGAALDRAQKEYSERHAARAAEDRKQVLYHSDTAADDLLIGATADGFLVRTADVTPFFSPAAHDLVRLEDLETVEWRTYDRPGKSDKPVWKGYHVLGYPAVAPEGTPIVLVEDLFGGAKTITMVASDGKPRRVRIDLEHRFVDPKVAPGGKYASLYDRPCASCEGALMAIELDQGKEVFGFDPSNQSLAGHVWLDASRLAFVYRPSSSAAGDEARLVLAVVDVAKGPASLRTLYTAAEGEAFSSPAASKDGEQIVMAYSDREGSGLVVVNVASGSLGKRHPVGAVRWPAFSPDGKRVAFELATPVGTEIAMLSVGDGEMKQLTENRSEDRYPRFSADGRDVLFEAHDSDPIFPRKRVLSRIASVAVPP